MMVPSSNFACSSKLSRQVLGNKQMSLCPAMPLLGMLNAMRLMSTLAARPELNGCQGTVISDVGDGRWAVRLKTGKKVSVRGTHMVLAGVACSAVGPSRDASCDLLAQSLAAGVHHSAGLPSNIGPASNCRHGGPDMGKGHGPFPLGHAWLHRYVLGDARAGGEIEVCASRVGHIFPILVTSRNG